MGNPRASWGPPLAIAGGALLAACASATVYDGDAGAHDPPSSTSPNDYRRDGGALTFPDLSFPDLAPAPPRPRSDEPNKDLPKAEWNCGETCFREPAAGSAASADPFAGPADGDATHAPAIVYPLPSSLHAINLPEIAVQWRRGTADQTTFRVRVEGAGKRYDFVTACRVADDPNVMLMANECVYSVPTWAWLAIGNDNRGKDVTLQVSAVANAGAPVASSAPVPISFSPGVVKGGLYYWSTALQGTYRVLFGGKRAVPFITPMSSTNRFSCGGCHALSRDGRIIAFAAEQTGYLTVSLTEDPTKRLVDPPNPPVTNGHVAALNADGTRALVSFGPPGNMANGQLTVWDTVAGKPIGALDPAVLGTPDKKVFFPEFSPDGTEVVATLASRDERPWSVKDGSIAVFPFNDGKFGRATILVPKDASLIHFYPSWSPDGKWIVFASGPAAHNSYDSPDARLRLVARDGGKVYDLGKATGAAGKTSTWPKFAPFMQASGQVMFITFNSKLDYGFLLPNSRVQQDQMRPQLWFAAIDLRRLDSGDPSYAPVWLPFQDTRQRNHLGYWTEQVVCSPTATTAEGGCAQGEICDQGQCTYNPTVE